MRNLFFPSILGVLLLCTCIAAGQSSSKRGGICFRVDDNPSLVRLHQFDSVLSKHQAKFCMAMTSWAFPLSPVYVDSLKGWIADGHEVMDNSPTHQTQFFNVLNIQDTLLYSGNPGVDHIASQKICLRVSNFDTTQPHGEGPLNISGNMVISQNSGEFSDLTGNPYFFAFYLSTPLKKMYLWYDCRAVNPADPDTVYLKSFWEEPVSLGTISGVSYHKLTQRNVIMHQSAIRLLGQRSLKIFGDLGITRPTTWIHPSGQMPWISEYDLKTNMGDSLGYTQGSNFLKYSYLGYNEYDPDGYASFGMQSIDFSTETKSFHENRHLIADAIARHYVKIDVSRFSNPVGGWDMFLSRTDSLLTWCGANNIPVRTYDQWRSLLYDSIPSRVVNIFPPLNVDLDEDNFPDGYEQTGMNGFYDTIDGVPASGNRSFGIYGNGNVCAVTSLAGLEPGINKFTIYTKGNNSPESNVSLSMTFPETGQVLNYDIPSDTSIWTEHFQLVNIPVGVSVANILISHQVINIDTVKISGMGLRSAGFLKETKLATQVKTANEPFASVGLDSLVIDSIYSPQAVTWTVRSGNPINFSILPGNILKVLKPSSFWVGRDSTYVIAHAPDGILDSCFMAFYSDSIGAGCAGLPIQLNLLDTLENDIVIWTSEPYDSTISNPNIYNPVVSPEFTTTYYILAINPLGPIHRDTLVLFRYPFPVPVVTNDTSVCYGYPVQLTVSGGVNYLWNTGQTNDTIVVDPPETSMYYVRVTSEHGCFTDDSVLVTRVDKPVIELFGLWPSYCANDPSSTVFGKPVGGTYYGSPGLIGDTFYPDLAPPGINKVYYSYTAPSGCSNLDSLSVNVVALPVVKPLPVTDLCADKFLVLHAGPGFDNYLWSNGLTDSIITFDSAGRGLGIHKIWVYVTKDGCADKDTAKINIVVCPIGVDENDAAQFFRIYPNPAASEITLYCDDKTLSETKCEILTINGDVIDHIFLKDRETKVNISHLKAGMYLLRFWVGNKVYKYRMLKL